MKKSSQGSGEKPKRNKEVKSKQGKMNPKEPFNKIVQYDSEESESSSDSDAVVFVSPEPNQRSVSLSAVSSQTVDYIVMENILKSKLKGRDCLNGVDFCAIMSIDQGNGSKGMKGNELKNI